MLVDLVITVCLAANPSHCRDEHLYFQSGSSVMNCIFLAQPEIAKWSMDHPKYTVKRWKCVVPDGEQKT